MSDTVVHNIKISYDESDERVRKFVTYLKSASMKEAMKSYYNQSQASSDKKININDEDGNEFTLACNENHICTLRLRGM